LLTAGVEQGRVYFTTEYVEGRPLTNLITDLYRDANEAVAQPPSAVTQGRPTRGALIEVLAAVARTIHYAHEQGIVHRDLKPSNIIVERGGGDLSERAPDPSSHGSPIITDFGLARETESGHTITAPGAAVGTALYMSPEQAEGDASKIGPATDIYALGCILYELLTGRPPFEGETAAAILGRKVRQRPPSPREADPSISRDLETICLKSLARSSRARYPTAEGLAIDLERHLAGVSIFASRPLIHRLPRFVRARPTHWAVIAATAVLLMAAVVYGYTRVGRTASTPRETTAAAGGPDAGALSPPDDPLAQFDVRITTYRPPGSEILCLATSGTEAWWGNPVGVVRHDMASGGNWFFPTGRVNEIVYAGGGAWWIAAGDGAYRYDGRRLTAYKEKDGLPYQSVIAIAVDGSNRTWFATPGGVALFDEGRWTTHLQHDGLPSESARTIAVDAEGHPWVGARRYSDGKVRGTGISRFDGRRWTTYTTEDGLADDDVRFIAPDVLGRVWVACWTQDNTGRYHGGVSRFDGATWTTYTEKNGLPDNAIHALTTDQQGRAWVGTGSNSYRGRRYEWRGGLTCIDTDGCRTYTTRDGLPVDNAQAVAIDGKGRTWVGTPNGLACLEKGTWTTHTEKNGLPYRDVRVVAIDPHDRPWVVTRDAAGRRSAVSSLRGAAWTTHTEQTGLSHYKVKDILIDGQDRVWVLTYEGLSRFDGDKWTEYGTESDLPSRHIRSIAIDAQGRLWAAVSLVDPSRPRTRRLSPNGVARLDGTAWTTYTEEDGLVSNDAQRIACDSHGRVWVATRHGLSCFDGGRWTAYTKKDGLPGDHVGDIAFDRQGQPWVAAAVGIARFDGERWVTCTPEVGRVSVSHIALDPQGRPWVVYTDLEAQRRTSRIAFFDGARWTTFTTRQVTAIVFDRQGRTWTGTRGGGTKQGGCVACFDGSRWTYYREKDGLASRDVSALAVDPEGRVWAGTGPERWRGRGLSCYNGVSWRTFTQKDGLAGNVTTSLAVGRDGNIWVGTTSGLSRIVLRKKE